MTRHFAAGAALLAATFVGQTASAKTLEEVLEQKGVISDKEKKEVAQSKAPSSYTIGKGFTFTSDDEKFRLYIGGRFQGRYTFTEKEDGAQNVSEWRVRRMKFWMGGHAYTPRLTYYLQAELAATASSNPSATLAAKLIDWAYVNYKLWDELEILVGQAKVPFGRQWLTSAGALEFVERTPVSDFFRPDYDIGIKLHGKVAKGILNYDVGGYGGKGKGILSTNNRNSFAARVSVDPLGYLAYGEADLAPTAKPLVSVGFNYFFDRLGTTPGSGGSLALETNNLGLSSSGGFLSSVSTANHFRAGDKIDINLAGVDAAAKWMGFYGIGEFFFGKMSGDKSNAEVHTRGFFVQGGYCIIPKTLEVAARYGYIDPNRDKQYDLRHEIGGALSYYIVKHTLKLQGDVSYLYDRASTVNRNNMQYRLQTQMDF
jgi:phosphate-selective porin OprO/OprP